jgi:hypothetical protein
LEKSEGHGTSPFLSKVNDAIEDSGTFAILSDHTMNSSSSNLQAALPSITGEVGFRESGSVPTPNLQKCGRVTEVLHFDVVSDLDI